MHTFQNLVADSMWSTIQVYGQYQFIYGSYEYVHAYIMDLVHLNMFMHIVELVGLGDTSVEAYYRLIALFKYGMV